MTMSAQAFYWIVVIELLIIIVLLFLRVPRGPRR